MNNPFLETMVMRQTFAQPWANNLRNQRTKLGWTQKMLAERLGVSITSIVNWENGHSIPSMPTFYHLCVTIHLSPNDLLGWE